MNSDSRLEFTPFDWSIAPADPNDLLLGQIVSCNPGIKNKARCVLFGLPFDGAVLGRKGAAAGPHAIRTQARLLKAYSYVHGELTQPVYDLGDVKLPAVVAKAHERATRAARKAMSHNTRAIALGGDHSLTFPCALPYLENERLAVINLDAHLDVRTVAPNEPFNSGTSFARLLERGLKSYTVVGARDFQTSGAYVRRVLDSGGSVITASEIFSKGPVQTALDVLHTLPNRIEAIYLSVDMDVADASVAPGVSAPTPGGLLAHQIFELIRIFCADPRIVACDIMELAPPLEEPGSDRTSRLAAACLAGMIASFK